MSPDRAATLSLLAALATMVVWGANLAVTKYVLAAIDVGPFLFIRFLTMPALGFAVLALVYRRHLMPPTAGVVAWLMLGEQFTALKLAGAALTMTGVAWAQYSAKTVAQAHPG